MNSFAKSVYTDDSDGVMWSFILSLALRSAYKSDFISTYLSFPLSDNFAEISKIFKISALVFIQADGVILFCTKLIAFYNEISCDELCINKVYHP